MIVDVHFHCWQLARGDYGWLTPALAQAEADAAVLGVVGWVDLLATDAPQRIARIAARPKLKALRPMLHDLPDAAWILQPALEPALRALVEHGLAFDALVRPAHLAVLLQLCLRHPDLRVVIDHAAKPDIAAGAWQPWADDLARLADETQAVCKLSGLLTGAGPAPQPQATRRWARQVLSRFGAGRVMWGSDWPVLELASTYAAWWHETRAALAGLGSAGCAAVLGGTARRVYRL